MTYLVEMLTLYEWLRAKRNYATQRAFFATNPKKKLLWLSTRDYWHSRINEINGEIYALIAALAPPRDSDFLI